MNRLYSRSPDVLWRNIGSSVLLRPVDRTDLMILDGSATLLWTLLAHPITFEDLVARMIAHYGVDSVLVSGPVAQALSDLERADLVKMDDVGAGPP